MIKIIESKSKTLKAKGIFSVTGDTMVFTEIDKNGTTTEENLTIDEINTLFDGKEVEFVIRTKEEKI